MAGKKSTTEFEYWLLEGLKTRDHVQQKHEHQDAWWKVMCLTGLDYFSTIGFQPGIAFLAAGLLSPFATFVLVLLTLFAAIPIYSRVAEKSPHGQGSFTMLERLLSGWRGKALVLVILGFAVTDFIITMTLSAADATAHIVENPFVPDWMHNRVAVTVALLLILSSVFLAGFKEAIGVAMFMVSFYLITNVVLLTRCTAELFYHPELLSNYFSALLSQHSPLKIVLTSLAVFPSLALGLSGFETGVSVMPHVKGDPEDDPQQPAGRIRNTKKLLITAASIMTVLLVLSSIVSTVLIPAELFQPNQEANGRALAYLAHKYLDHTFGTIYDISTVLILWFAGASTMAGLLSLIPRYLPRYGMAPEWVRALRPLVLVITAINVVVTIIFRADVDAQAGAFATGLLVLFTSASFAVVLSVWNEGLVKRFYFVAILLVFIYTTISNMIQRPEGLQISAVFILMILISSLASRATRATELRVKSVEFDERATKFIEQATRNKWKEVRLLAHRPGDKDYKHYQQVARKRHSIQEAEGDFIFLEVLLKDASDFAAEDLQVTGHQVSGYNVMRCSAAAVPNAIAAILLEVRKETGKVPHIYMQWTEGHPLAYVFKYLFLGEGETAPLTREILRTNEPDENERPMVHVS